MQAFIDWKAIRDNIEAVKANVKNRNSDADPEKVSQLYDEYNAAQRQAEQLRSDRNANAKAMKVFAYTFPLVAQAHDENFISVVYVNIR